MNDYVKFLLSILLVVVSFFGTIFITAPVVITVYELLIQPTTHYVINKSLVIGSLCVFHIYTFHIINTNEETDIAKSFGKLLTFYIYLGIVVVAAYAYSAIL